MITTKEIELLAQTHDLVRFTFGMEAPEHDLTAAALRSLAAERDILQTENALLREALTNAAAVIGSFYAFAETADAVSISGIARCHAMLTSMKKNRRRIEETVMTPARAALGEKE